MSFSPLASMKLRIPEGGRSSPRNTAITGFGLHHNAGVNAYGEASNPRREVSANYWITDSGLLIPNIRETRRAWTSGMAGYPAGAAADRRNLTVEISNTAAGVRNRSWEVSDAALDMLTDFMGEAAARLNMGKIIRGKNRGVGVHKDWVPTSCPGPFIMNRLSWIIAEAEKRRRVWLKGGKPSGGGGASKPAPAGREWPEAVLVIDGQFGPITRRAYQRLLAPKSVGNYSGRIDGQFARMSITAEQRWLRSLGYYRGRIDGVRGPLTVRALQAFLYDKGHYRNGNYTKAVLVDGYFGPRSVRALQAYLNSQRKYYGK